METRTRVSPEGLYTYPDVVAFCGAPIFADNHADTLINPVLICKILSPSTEAYDRGLKFEQYRKIESLKEYVLVWQNQPRIEVFRKQPDGQWLWTDFAGLDAMCQFSVINCALPLAEIYSGVEFEPVTKGL